MKVGIVGTGYVGLVTGVSLAEKGHEVLCLDVDRARVDMVNRGVPPFFEPGLEEALGRVVSSGNLRASDSYGDLAGFEVVLICVNTPSAADGSMDSSQLVSAAASVGDVLGDMKKSVGFPVVAVKSTVLPGTTLGVVRNTLESVSGMVAGVDFGLAMVPEFLREGSALEDARRPDRVVVGAFDRRSGDVLSSLYGDFGSPVVVTDAVTAEMVKYVANSFLATKISFANEMARICDRVGADVYRVMDIVAMDRRIERSFLNAGPGFGGSCFPKDVRALARFAEENNVRPLILRSVLEINESQPVYVVDVLEKVLGGLRNRRVAVLGLSFKGGTDDVRESRAFPIVRELKKRGANVVCYDPAAGKNFAEKEPVDLAEDIKSALEGADACVIQSDWDEFRSLQPGDFRVMKTPVVYDTRRVLGFESGEVTVLRVGGGIPGIKRDTHDGGAL